MKNLFLALCIFMCFINVHAAYNYEIFKVTGHVEVNNNGWHVAKKHEVVDSLTEFKIYKGGEIVIFDKENGQTIKYDKPTNGQLFLRDIIRESNSNFSSTLYALIKTLFSGQGKKKLDYKTIGGVKLGSGNNIEKDLSDIIKSTAFSKEWEKSKYVNSSLVLSKLINADKTFSFKIANMSNDSLYVNIVAYDKDLKTYSFPFDVLKSNDTKTLDGLYIFLPAHEEILLNQITFVKCKNVQYRVFGSTEYFEIHTVAQMIENSSMKSSQFDNGSYNIYLGVNK